jgi:hypothetical protein
LAISWINLGFWVVKALSVAVGRFGSDEDEFVPENETELSRIV